MSCSANWKMNQTCILVLQVPDSQILKAGVDPPSSASDPSLTAPVIPTFPVHSRHQLCAPQGAVVEVLGTVCCVPDNHAPLPVKHQDMSEGLVQQAASGCQLTCLTFFSA